PTTFPTGVRYPDGSAMGDPGFLLRWLLVPRHRSHGRHLERRRRAPVMPMKASLALLFGLVIAIGACWWFAKERRVSVGMLSPKVFYLCYSSIDPEFP